MIKRLPLLVVVLLLASCARTEAMINAQTITPSLNSTAEPSPSISSSPTFENAPYPPPASFTPVPYPISTGQPKIGEETQTPSVSATPVAFPLLPTYIIDAVFTDKDHGWLIGLAVLGEAKLYAMATTSDGGGTWKAIPIPNINSHYEREQNVGLFFADKNTGWFFIRRPYSNGLYSTSDGGLTWVDEHPKGSITKIEKAADGTIWALEQDSDSWILWKASTKSYKTWEKSRAKFPVDLSKAQLVIADDQHAWLTYWVYDEQTTKNISHILATQDGGQSWIEIHSPCNEYSATFGLVLTAIDTQNLWLGCGPPGSAGSGSKFVFGSSDGGRTWTLRGIGAVTAEDNLSTVGYFHSIGAVSPQFAYMTWYRFGSIVITRDGGKTWEYSPLECAIDYLKAFFIDTEHGWAFDQNYMDFEGRCIDRTADGGKTWECTRLPDNKPCIPSPPNTPETSITRTPVPVTVTVTEKTNMPSEIPTPTQGLVGPFQVSFDPDNWEWKTENGFIVLANRRVPRCTISEMAGRGLGPDWSVEHSRKVIGDIEFSISTVYSKGQLRYIVYCTTPGKSVVACYQVYFVEKSANCLKEAESVLSTLRFSKYPPIGIAP